jgi:uncharacterized protein (DUF1501 family)
MRITRRRFIQQSGLVAAGTLLGPSLWRNALVREALASTIGDRYLVIVYLDGGNDGLNTVVPYSSGALRAAYDGCRHTGGGGINLSQASLAGTTIGTDPGTGTQLALHPALAGLKQLYDLGGVAVIQGCGYPEYSMSHDQARSIWRSANPAAAGTYSGIGWMGRHLAYPGNYAPADVPGVTIGSAVAPELRQSATGVLAITELRDFGFPYDVFNLNDVPAKRAAFTALHGTWASASPQPAKQYIGTSAESTLLSSESYPALDEDYERDRAAFSARYDAIGKSMAHDLREIAKIVYGVERGVPGVAARFFQLRNAGYDTHADQGGAEPDGQHAVLHAELGDSLRVFWDDLADMGAVHKVTVLVWSEFGRRVPQNGSGTDHGSQGPILVVGGSVVGGIYGNHPDIVSLDANENTPYTQGAGPHRSTDFRDVYGTVLKHWLNMPPAQILSAVLPLDGGDPATSWTVADFDLAFLV